MWFTDMTLLIDVGHLRVHMNGGQEFEAKGAGASDTFVKVGLFVARLQGCCQGGALEWLVCESLHWGPSCLTKVSF